MDGWFIPVTGLIGGQVTAHGTVTALAKGTVTAQVQNVVTAESRGQVTAVGTITAEAKGTVTAAINNVVTAESRGFITAQLTGGWPVVIKGDWKSGFLLSGLADTGTGQALDFRSYSNAGFVQAMSSGCSASASLLASYDSASWLSISSIGLAGNGTATAQISGMYPWLCARVDNAYNNGGGATAITANVWLHVTKG
jgi:hypothetical protein